MRLHIYLMATCIVQMLGGMVVHEIGIRLRLFFPKGIQYSEHTRIVCKYTCAFEFSQRLQVIILGPNYTSFLHTLIPRRYSWKDWGY